MFFVLSDVFGVKVMSCFVRFGLYDVFVDGHLGLRRGEVWGDQDDWGDQGVWDEQGVQENQVKS